MIGNTSLLMHSKVPPKKQQSMFHIDLGQNDGPFKRVALMMTKQQSRHTRHHSSRSKGYFRPDQPSARESRNTPTTVTRLRHTFGSGLLTPGVVSTNLAVSPSNYTGDGIHSFKQNIQDIEFEIRKAFEAVDDIKEEEDQIRLEIKRITKQQIDENTSTQLSLHPLIQKNHQHLKGHMIQQKNINDHFTKSLMELKKHLIEVMGDISSNLKRFGDLEKEAGVETSREIDESVEQ